MRGHLILLVAVPAFLMCIGGCASLKKYVDRNGYPESTEYGQFVRSEPHGRGTTQSDGSVKYTYVATYRGGPVRSERKGKLTFDIDRAQDSPGLAVEIAIEQQDVCVLTTVLKTSDGYRVLEKAENACGEPLTRPPHDFDLVFEGKELDVLATRRAVEIDGAAAKAVMSPYTYRLSITSSEETGDRVTVDLATVDYLGGVPTAIVEREPVRGDVLNDAIEEVVEGISARSVGRLDVEVAGYGPIQTAWAGSKDGEGVTLVIVTGDERVAHSFEAKRDELRLAAKAKGVQVDEIEVRSSSSQTGTPLVVSQVPNGFRTVRAEVAAANALRIGSVAAMGAVARRYPDGESATLRKLFVQLARTLVDSGDLAEMKEYVEFLPVEGYAEAVEAVERRTTARRRVDPSAQETRRANPQSGSGSAVCAAITESDALAVIDNEVRRLAALKSFFAKFKAGDTVEQFQLMGDVASASSKALKDLRRVSAALSRVDPTSHAGSPRLHGQMTKVVSVFIEHNRTLVETFDNDEFKLFLAAVARGAQMAVPAASIRDTLREFLAAECGT